MVSVLSAKSSRLGLRARIKDDKVSAPGGSVGVSHTEQNERPLDAQPLVCYGALLSGQCAQKLCEALCRLSAAETPRTRLRGR